jgi:bifunctional UDP-N-acetylglucosamine pyrophosphorylase/glucosamine-1-phosphate N-acetyltransferase
MAIDCIVLAGGISSRFPSPLPKVFYPFIDKPIINHILDLLYQRDFKKIIVVTGKRTHALFAPYEEAGLIQRAFQVEPLGTWDAVMTALPLVESPHCFIINGDMPLIEISTLQKVFDSQADFTLVSTLHPNPIGYGRLIRNQKQQVEALIEDKHLEDHQYFFKEINAGIYKFKTTRLKNIAIKKQTSTNEWYLTGLWEKGSPYLSETKVIVEKDYRTLTGINSWQDFEMAEFLYYQLQRERFVKQGALLKNAHTIYIQGVAQCEPYVHIEGPCILEGPVELAADVSIKPYGYIIDTKLEKNTVVEPFSCLKNIFAGHDCVLGPFLKATEKTLLQSFVNLGSFVEIKRSTLGIKTKAKHLSYIADATIGSYCNIGAFVVFCNYDGQRKHQSILGDSVFVGSSSQLIAPITLHDNAYIGAGTTLTKNVTAGSLITRRASIKIVENWREIKRCAES